MTKLIVLYLGRDEGRPGGGGSRISRLEDDDDLSGIDEEQLRLGLETNQ